MLSTSDTYLGPRPFRSNEIPPDEVVRLLDSHSLGRVSWDSPDGPLTLPITYLHRDQSIVFRTSPYGHLSDLVRPQHVAFEIDELSEASESGWSVLVRGHSSGVSDPQEITTLWQESLLRPWAHGVRNLFIKISIERMSGRSFGD